MANSRRALLIIFLVVFIDLLGFGLVLPLLPRFADELGAGNLEIGVLQAVFSLMQFLFSPFWGRLSDRIGRRPVLLIGLLGSTIFYGLFGVALAIGSIPLMFLSRLGAGVAGATIATAQAFIADSTPPEKRTAGMAIIGAAFGVGFIFGPLIGGLGIWIEEQLGYTGLTGLPGYLASLFSLTAFLLAVAILPESLHPGSRSPQGGWMNLLQLRSAASMPGVLELISVFFLATFAFAMFETTVARLAKDIFELNFSRTYLLFALFGFLLVIAQGLVRSLSKRMPDKQLSTSGCILLMIGMGGTVLASELGELWLLFTLPIFLVTGFAFLTTSTQSMISTHTTADAQGGVLGLNQSASSMARILGPVIGNLAYGVRPTLPYSISAALMVIVLFIVFWVPSRAATTASEGAIDS